MPAPSPEAFVGVALVGLVAGALLGGAYAVGRTHGVASVCDAIACEAPTDPGDVLCTCPSPNRDPYTDPDGTGTETP